MSVLCLVGKDTENIVKDICESVGIELQSCSTTEEACHLILSSLILKKSWIAVVAALGTQKDNYCLPLLKLIKNTRPEIFTIIYSHTAQDKEPIIRLECYKAGAKMVTCYPTAIKEVLQDLKTDHDTTEIDGSVLQCPICKMRNLTENVMHRHLERHHTYDPNLALNCPICNIIHPVNRGGLQVHFHNKHGPLERREIKRGPSGSLTAFSLVVCQRESDGKFLMVQEPLGVGGGYWLPAGRVDPGEKLTDGGLREALEEAGIHIVITRVLKINLSNALRIIYLANPVQGTDTTPKTIPDFESAGAVWVSASEVTKKLTKEDCRGGVATEPLTWFPKVAAGERGIDINTQEYSEFETVVQELGQRRCTLEDIDQKFLPSLTCVASNILSGQAIKSNFSTGELSKQFVAQMLYFDLCA